ncbi:hypothetical protein OC834_002877 [Tilletia horrida]|nr:hypothetical protein OC834_002877 [Tilletia horrida]
MRTRKQSKASSSSAAGPSTSSATTSSGAVRGSKRTAQPSSLRKSSNKRIKTEAPKAASPAESTTTSSASSAIERLLGVYEVWTSVFAHLEHDRIDLVEFSRVSRRARAVALPRLFEAVNVPLAKAQRLVTVLKGNAGLVEQIKFLRIWDDAADYLAHNNPQAFPIPISKSRTTQPATATKTKWKAFGTILGLVRDRKCQEPPKLELSFGQLHLHYLFDQLQLHTEVLTQLVALRIFDDFDPILLAQSMTSVESESLYFKHGPRMSEDLEDILTLVLDAQDRAGSDAFRLFHFTAFKVGHVERASMLPKLTPELQQRLANRIEDLLLVATWANDNDAQVLGTLLGITKWPKLRKLVLSAHSGVNDIFTSLWQTAARIKRTHPNLTHARLDIECESRGIWTATWTQSQTEMWTDVQLPQLQEYWLIPHPEMAGRSVMHFFDRHTDIKELSFFPTNTQFARDTVGHPNLLDSVRVLQSRYDVVNYFLAKGGAPHAVQITERNERSVRHPATTYTPPAKCASITSWSLVLSTDAFHEVISDPRTFLPDTSALPNLTEFVLYTGSNSDTARERFAASSLVDLLAELLQALQPATKLRAVHIRECISHNRPKAEDLDGVITELPPALEYLSWHSPVWGQTVYFRPLRPSPDTGLGWCSESTTMATAAAGLEGKGKEKGKNDAAKGKAKETEKAVKGKGKAKNESPKEEGGTAKTIRWQRLPVCFWPKVDTSTGIWAGMDEVTKDPKLFDHLCGPPQLRYCQS